MGNNPSIKPVENSSKHKIKLNDDKTNASEGDAEQKRMQTKANQGDLYTIKESWAEELAENQKLSTQEAESLSKIDNKNQPEVKDKFTPGSLLTRLVGEAMKVTSYIKSIAEVEELPPKDNFDEDPKINYDELEQDMNAINEHVNRTNNDVRSECYYCTKNGKVKGMLTIKDSIIIFDPLIGDENAKFPEISEYNCFIDKRDIGDAQILKLPNETAQYIKNEKHRQGYIYDYYLQLLLSTVNGNAINRILSKHKEKNLSVPYNSK